MVPIRDQLKMNYTAKQQYDIIQKCIIEDIKMIGIVKWSTVSDIPDIPDFVIYTYSPERYVLHGERLQELFAFYITYNYFSLLEIKSIINQLTSSDKEAQYLAFLLLANAKSK